MNHPELVQIVEDEDLEILKDLEDLEVEEFGDNGFKITFKFKEDSAYFNQKSITVSMEDEEVTLPKLSWKPNKNPATPKESANAKKRASPYSGFFNIFDSEHMEMDELVDVFNVIAADLYCNAFQYYSGEQADDSDSDAADELYEMDDDEDDSEGSGDCEESDDDAESEEDEE
ncbi:MAG: NAP domain-containing protein [Lactococcus garvieae]